MSVRRAQAEIDSAEYADWCEFFSVEPHYGDRLELMIAQLTCLIANVNRTKKSRPFKIKDFILEFAAKAKQTPDQMKAILRQAGRAAKAVVGRGKR